MGLSFNNSGSDVGFCSGVGAFLSVQAELSEQAKSVAYVPFGRGHRRANTAASTIPLASLCYLDLQSSTNVEQYHLPRHKY